MRGWIAAVLLVTFASGGMTGGFIGRATAPVPKPPSFVERQVEHLRSRGVTGSEDLARAREIYALYQDRVEMLKGQVYDLLKDHVDRYAAEAEADIREILGKYEKD